MHEIVSTVHIQSSIGNIPLKLKIEFEHIPEELPTDYSPGHAEQIIPWDIHFWDGYEWHFLPFRLTYTLQKPLVEIIKKHREDGLR
jgi:hypothetical protein